MRASSDPRPRLAVLCAFSGDGGVERVIKLLCAEFAQQVQVDLLAIKLQGQHARELPADVRVIELKARHSLTAIPELRRYLQQTPPDAMLVAKDRAGRAALSAARWARSPVPIWLQLHSNLSAALAGRSALSRALRLWPIPRIYPRARGVIAVSEGVRRDALAVSRLPASRVHALPNPVYDGTLAQQAAAPVPHPWLAQKQGPVVMGIGRLTPQKDFSSLMHAFSRLPPAARLILLGEGKERAALTALAQELGIAERVLMPGFVPNPYAWLARADLFVLSSRWEGFGLALAEALALGIPSVATDCPSGPGEILDGGRHGSLVPVADVEALAAAMARTLTQPLPAQALIAAVQKHRADVSARQYLNLMFSRDT